MSTKALKKELMAAVAMMLVAVIALSGSTFAWFAQNTVVRAESVEVAAKTSKNLAITPGAVTDPEASFGTIATLTKPTKTTFSAVTAADSVSGDPIESIGNASSATVDESVEFYALTADNKVTDPSKHNATVTLADAITNKGTTPIATNFALANNENWWSQDVSLLYTAATDADAVEITAAAIVSVATEAGIDHALHLAILTTGGAWTMSDMPTTAPVKNDTTGKYEYKVDFGKVVDLAANKPDTLKLYIWFEGEDTDCTSNKATIENSMSIVFDFGMKGE